MPWGALSAEETARPQGQLWEAGKSCRLGHRGMGRASQGPWLVWEASGSPARL